MIDARELRIGNWVKWVFPNRNNQPNKIKDCQVQSIGGLVGVLDSAYGYDQVEPIPLTEQWLIDFGFEKGHDRNYYLSNGRVTLQAEMFNEGQILFSVETNVGMGFNSVICTPDQVHLLQNLWHAFTREELTKK